MSSAAQAGDSVPPDVRQELVEAIEAEKRLWPKQVLRVALDYARQHLNMDHPTPAALWDYILERLQAPVPWRYAKLDDYSAQLGYALKNADGRGLYIKLRFNDESWVVGMSFHD